MRAEVIAVGDELTSGVRLDTNTQWLSSQLEQAGIPVAFHTTVGDAMADMVGVLRSAVERAEVVVVSGGLGPTADDLTRQVLAEVTGQSLVTDQAVLQHIEQLFARRGREMPARNVVQAQFPLGSRVLANPHGTAPGIRCDLPRSGSAAACVIFALPGVPAELKQMWSESVEPQLGQLPGRDQRVIRHRIIRCFGAGESDIEQRLPDLVRRGRCPSVGITASQATISLRITAAGTTPEDCYAAMEPTAETIYACLGPLIYGEGDETLQQVVTRTLEQRKLSLATVEWGTQGLLSSWLAETGSSSYVGGLTVAAAEGLAPLGLAVQQPGEPAERWVAQMAEAWQARVAADLVVAVGPSQGSPSIHFALATQREVSTHSSIFAAHPSIQRPRAAKEALNWIRLWLSATAAHEAG